MFAFWLVLGETCPGLEGDELCQGVVLVRWGHSTSIRDYPDALIINVGMGSVDSFCEGYILYPRRVNFAGKCS
jgi:hypothetical protein